MAGEENCIEGSTVGRLEAGREESKGEKKMTVRQGWIQGGRQGRRTIGREEM